MTHTLTELVLGSVPSVTDDTRGFWEGTLAEELRVQACTACGHRQLPGGPCCERCLSRDLTWVKASGEGSVFSFTIVRRALHPSFAHDVPYVVADIELAEGPIMISNVTDIEADQVAIGMPVQVWFDEQVEDAFHVPLRLPKFRPRSD